MNSLRGAKLILAYEPPTGSGFITSLFTRNLEIEHSTVLSQMPLKMKPLPLNSEENGQTIPTRHRRSALYGGSIIEEYFLLIFNTHISFQSCNRCSTTYIRRSPRQHFLKYCRCAVYMQHMSFVIAFETISVYVKLLQFSCI